MQLDLSILQEFILVQRFSWFQPAALIRRLLSLPPAQRVGSVRVLWLLVAVY